MAAERAVLSCQVLLICSLYILAFGSHVRKLTSDDLRNIGQSTKNDFIAVFFDKPGEFIFNEIWMILLHASIKCSIICFKNSREVVYLPQWFFVYFTLYLYLIEIRSSYPKFTREFVKSSDVLEPFGIELAKVSNRKIKLSILQLYTRYLNFSLLFNYSSDTVKAVL